MMQKIWFPSKVFDLGKENTIDTLHIKNFNNNDISIPLFSIFLSNNNQDWVCYYTQPSHHWDNPTEFDIHLSKKIQAQYIKFQLNSKGNLDKLEITLDNNHIDNNEEIINISSFIEKTKKEAANSRIVISTLFNESDDYLMLYINNFLFFTPENVILILNFPHNRPIPKAALTISDRIIIINGGFKRHKWGNTLLLGHLETLEYAKNNLVFDYFCTMASNSLFVRHLTISSILNQLNQKALTPIASQRSYDYDVDLDAEITTNHGTWMWHHYKSLPQLKEHIINEIGLTRISATQIEGLFAHKKDWFLILEKVEEIKNLAPFLSSHFFVALEEVIPISIFNQFGSGYYTHICFMLWTKPNYLIEIKEILSIGSQLPDHISSIKWFPRDCYASTTLAVCTSWGRQLIGLEKKEKLPNKLQASIILNDFLQAIKSRIQTLPLTEKWKPDKKNSALDFHWNYNNYPVERQRFYLDIGQSFTDSEDPETGPAHLFFENTNHLVDLSLFLIEKKNTCNILRYFCLSFDAQKKTLVSNISELEGYLYLSSQQKNKSIKISIDKNKMNNYHHYQKLFERFVEHTNIEGPHNYFVRNWDLKEENENKIDYYFLNCQCIGTPIISNNLIEVEMSIF